MQDKSHIVLKTILIAIALLQVFPATLKSEELCTATTEPSVFKEFLGIKPKFDYSVAMEMGSTYHQTKPEAQRLALQARKRGYTNVKTQIRQSGNIYFQVCVSFAEDLPIRAETGRLMRKNSNIDLNGSNAYFLAELLLDKTLKKSGRQYYGYELAKNPQESIHSALNILRAEDYPVSAYMTQLTPHRRTLDKTKIAMWIASNPRAFWLISREGWKPAPESQVSLALQRLNESAIMPLIMEEHVYVPPRMYSQLVQMARKENMLVTDEIAIPESERSKIAVTDFDSLTEEISSLEALAISEFLRSALVETQTFRVINRQDMNKLLTEMRVQQSGYTSSSDAAQVGQVLNAQKVIVGSISVLGEVFYINVNMVNVETHEIEFAKSATAYSIDDLQSAMNDLAVEIAKSVLQKEERSR
ncbi:CsgG/HfaB family protein [Elusimicrobiota bacterium]